MIILNGGALWHYEVYTSTTAMPIERLLHTFHLSLDL